MNTFVIISISLVVLAIVVGMIFLITTLVQIRRTAREAECFVHHLNEVGKIVDSVSSFSQSIGNPWIRIGALLSGLGSLVFMKKKKKVKE